MKYLVFLAITACLLMLVTAEYFHTKQSVEPHHKSESSPWLNGIWKKKYIWKPRWVKTWKEKKIYVSIWKKVWGPVEVNEWIPIPKPPPGWH